MKEFLSDLAGAVSIFVAPFLLLFILWGMESDLQKTIEEINYQKGEQFREN